MVGGFIPILVSGCIAVESQGNFVTIETFFNGCSHFCINVHVGLLLLAPHISEGVVEPNGPSIGASASSSKTSVFESSIEERDSVRCHLSPGGAATLGVASTRDELDA